jgi:GNAT superfamily N-acetyltransferase
VERAIAGSLNFGIYDGAEQVGFARVATDYATFGYVMDVFVLPGHRGKGLSVWLMQTILAHPRLQGFRMWRLATRDAHGVYEKVGFRRVAHPENLMEVDDANVYSRQER